MRKTIIIAIAASLIAGFATTITKAADPNAGWIAEMQKHLVVNGESIKAVKLASERCNTKSEEHPRACAAAFKVVLSRREAERAHIEANLEVLALNPEDQGRHFNRAAPIPEFNRMNRETDVMFTEVKAIFPVATLR